VRLIVTGSSARIHDRVGELRATRFEAQEHVADLSEEDQVLELATWAVSSMSAPRLVLGPVIRERRLMPRQKLEWWV